MRLLIAVDHRLPPSLNDAEVVDWLRSPSPLLGMLTPLDAMEGSGSDIRHVRDFAERMLPR